MANNISHESNAVEQPVDDIVNGLEKWVPPRVSKPQITDVEGLDKAYGRGYHNLYRHNNTLFVSGTHVTNPKDYYYDVTIPIGQLKNTKRYRQVENLIRLYPEIDTLVGHSLGAAIVTDITLRYPQIKQARAYGSPTIKSHPKIQYFRHHGDPVSISNRLGNSASNIFHIGNPHSYRGFKPFYN